MVLPGTLGIPPGARGVVLFSHGSGSSRLSPRNTFVASVLRAGGIGTLLFDLLTPEEDQIYETRFDIDLLTERLMLVTGWLRGQQAARELNIGYFGASTGSASALRAAAELGPMVRAVVSRGGRPDLAMESLSRVQAAVLLIVGGSDTVVIGMNQEAFTHITAPKQLEIIPGATHLFEEPGALEEVARLATQWFQQHLGMSEGRREAA
ncbi:MAG: dienelactone hydrolase family protein [Armatimonadota bacterium]